MSLSLRRRLIEESDLAAVAALLAQGFPETSPERWRRGLDRLRRRHAPVGYPRYGRLLDVGGRVVGVLLTIHCEVPDGSGGVVVRCNLSSWYVEPSFAGHAPFLFGGALRDEGVTYINISPAPHTMPIVEALGFRPFAAGSVATVPILARRRARGRVRLLGPEEAARLPDGALVADHVGLGCLCLVVEAADGRFPFVFAPPERLNRFLPATRLLYCRDVAHYVRFAGALGRALLRHGSVATVVDGSPHLPGVPGRRINIGQKRYVVGPHPPRPGDLAYTELAFLR